MTDYTKQCIQESLKTMKDAIETAEREAAWKTDDVEAVGRVLHAFAWGHANATTSLLAAMNSASRSRQLEKP